MGQQPSVATRAMMTGERTSKRCRSGWGGGWDHQVYGGFSGFWREKHRINGCTEFSNLETFGSWVWAIYGMFTRGTRYWSIPIWSCQNLNEVAHVAGMLTWCLHSRSFQEILGDGAWSCWPCNVTPGVMIHHGSDRSYLIIIDEYMEHDKRLTMIDDRSWFGWYLVNGCKW